MLNMTLIQSSHTVLQQSIFTIQKTSCVSIFLQVIKYKLVMFILYIFCCSGSFPTTILCFMGNTRGKLKKHVGWVT